MSRPPHILIVTPALASANNGNWRTTDRWQQFLAPFYSVQAIREYTDQPCDLMIALHARRSAQSILRFSRTGKPLMVVLTGTDLYRDIRHDDSAKKSLELADQLVVLQDQGLNELNADSRSKCQVIEQSAPQLHPLPQRPDRFDLALIGHLRAEKDPLTALRAVQRLDDSELRLLHVGKTDDPELAPAFLEAASNDDRIELLGLRNHDETRAVIAKSRALLLPSVMEGGANVLIEAVTSGVPVLASRIPGSIGLLGDDYPGYFDVGNDEQLAQLIGRIRSEPKFLADLTARCASRAWLFSPERESDLLNKLVAQMLTAS